MKSVTTSAQATNAIRLYGPMSEKTLEGKPKIPAPTIPLIAIATRSQRRMPRTRPSSDTFGTALAYNLNCSPKQSISLNSLTLMKRNNVSFFAAAGILAVTSLTTVFSQTAPSPRSLQSLVDEAAKTTLQKFADKKLGDKQLSITLIDLRDPKDAVTASFRGNERIYPASVVKLFYLVAAQRWLEDKKIEDTPELRRALKDMIVDSSNEATQYVVDVI